MTQNTDYTTPQPWVYKVPNGNTEDLPYIENDKGVEVLSFGNVEEYYPTEGTPPSPEDASLIVRAVNSYDALVEVAEMVSAWGNGLRHAARG